MKQIFLVLSHLKQLYFTVTVSEKPLFDLNSILQWLLENMNINVSRYLLRFSQLTHL